MSLILDALKRAERERQGETLPAPRAPMSVAGRAPPPPRVWLFAAAAAIAAVALVGVALGGWKVWKERSTREAAPAVVEQPTQPPVIVARPAPPEPATTVVPGTETVASLDDLSDEPTLEGPATPAPKPVLVVPAAKDPGPDVIATKPAPAPKVSRPAEIPPDAAQAAPPKPSPPKVTAPQPQPAPEPAAQAQPTPSQPAAQPPPEPQVQEGPAPEIPPALTQPAPLRKFREMPPDYRADFPALKIEIHVYEKAPQRRFVMINGRKYREGERLAEGPSLIEIVQDGIVLEYRGEKVLYTLGR